MVAKKTVDPILSGFYGWPKKHKMACIFIQLYYYQGFQDGIKNLQNKTKLGHLGV